MPAFKWLPPISKASVRGPWLSCCCASPGAPRFCVLPRAAAGIVPDLDLVSQHKMKQSDQVLELTYVSNRGFSVFADLLGRLALRRSHAGPAIAPRILRGGAPSLRICRNGRQFVHHIHRSGSCFWRMGATRPGRWGILSPSKGLERQDEENAAMAESGTPSKDQSDLQSLPLDKLEAKLGTSPQTGLTKGEAEQRLAQYGPNEIAEKTVNPLLKFLSYFWEPRPVLALRVPRVVVLKPQVEDVREGEAGDQTGGATPAQKLISPNHGHGGTLLKVEGAG